MLPKRESGRFRNAFEIAMLGVGAGALLLFLSLAVCGGIWRHVIPQNDGKLAAVESDPSETNAESTAADSPNDWRGDGKTIRLKFGRYRFPLPSHSSPFECFGGFVFLVVFWVLAHVVWRYLSGKLAHATPQATTSPSDDRCDDIGADVLKPRRRVVERGEPPGREFVVAVEEYRVSADAKTVCVFVKPIAGQTAVGMAIEGESPCATSYRAHRSAKGAYVMLNRERFERSLRLETYYLPESQAPQRAALVTPTPGETIPEFNARLRGMLTKSA